MSRWFRHYAGLARDEKLVRVAIDGGFTIERVVWVWCAILESAGEINEDGRFDVSVQEISRFLRCTTKNIEAIFSGLVAAGRIRDGVVTTWNKRNFKSDSSTDRVLKHRKKRDQTVSETEMKRFRNAPETETETERKKDSAPDGASKYFFESGVIRLTEKDFRKWRESFSNLDLRAELLGLTQWAGQQQDWFFAVSGALAKRNREVGIKLKSQPQRQVGRVII